MKNLAQIRGFKNAAIGTIMAWSGSSGDIPQGWLSCDGAGFPNDRYPLLKDVLGYTYGGSDNAGTFNVPNLNNNRVPVHKGSTYTSQGGSSSGNVGLYASWSISGRPNKTVSFGAMQMTNSNAMWSRDAYIQPRMLSRENIPTHGHNETIERCNSQLHGGNKTAETGSEQTRDFATGNVEVSLARVGGPNDAEAPRQNNSSGHTHGSITYTVNKGSMGAASYQQQYSSDNLSLNNNPGAGSATLQLTPPYQTAVYIIKAF